jgi:DNA-directed RNA polymerase subunit omega
MNAMYLEKAKERMPNIPLLVNVVSKRVRQLNAGQRPLIKPDTPDMDHLDLALKEIAEGKLSAELGSFSSPRIDRGNSSLLAL